MGVFVLFWKERKNTERFIGMEGLRKMFGTQDMTVGKPLSNLASFSIPLLIGNFAQQMYNTVDSIVVGKYVGDNALAAVGASGPILNLLILLFVGISTGAGIMVAQYYGAKKQEELSKTIGSCMTLILVSSAIVMLVGPLIARPLITLLGTPDTVAGMAVDYLVIIFLGILGGGAYNIISGILRGMGDSFYPLVFLVVACLLNIALDLLFVCKFRMGVPGVAWATIIAQMVSGALCVIRLLRMKDTVRITKKSLIPDRLLTAEIVRLGLPSGLTQAVFSMASIVVQRLTNSFGELIMAVSVVVMRVDGFAMLPNFTFGIALTTFVGQNVGAGRMDRVHEGVRSGLRAGLAIAAALVALILLGGRPLMGLFTETQAVVDTSMHMMKILSVGYIAMAITQSLSGVMRGAGDTVTPMWISLVTTVVIRMPLAYLIAYLTRSEAQPNGTPDALFISLLVAWISGAVITSIFYKRGKWKKKSVMVE